MIILNEELLKDNQNFLNLVENEKVAIKNTLKAQKQLKEILLNYLQKIVDCTETNISEEHINSFLNFLNEIKKVLDNCNENISCIKNLLNKLNQIISEINNNTIISNSELLKEFNNDYKKMSSTVSKNTLDINAFLKAILHFSELKFNNEKAKIDTIKFQSNEVQNDVTNIQKNDTKPKEEITKDDVQVTPENKASDTKKDTILKNTNAVSDSQYVENTLIISETKGKIFLPYTLSNVTEIQEKHPKNFPTIDDVIAKEFTLPFSSFKELSIARFREAFKLMRRKEKASLKASFELAMELLFNYNLHPAIIPACKNVDELDIYLDCLENNETDKFDCFKIVFEIPPVLSKKKRG
jgi:hypothetical protein